MSEELRSCPFCGGKATINEISRNGYHFAECESCAIGMCAERTKAEAITAWNTRADFPGITDPAAFVAAARGCVEALEQSREGWANAIEFGLIPERHRNAAQILADNASAATSAFRAATGDMA